MTETEQRYEATKRRVADFEDALSHAEDRAAERDPLLQLVLRKNIEDELQTMYEHLADHEGQREGEALASALTVGADVPTVLIRARIASGLRQADLARRLNLTEQQVRKFEASRYAGVAADQVQAIARALGVTRLINATKSDRSAGRAIG